MSELRNQLIRMAYENPTLRPHLLPILAESMDKVAVSADTEDFVSWVLSTQEPMTEEDVRDVLVRKLGLKISPPLTKRPGPRFQPGDSVIIKAEKHKNPATADVYKEWNGKIGDVIDSVDNDVVVKFRGGDVVTFPDGLKAQGVGIMKYTAPYTIEGSPKVEMIYLADPDGPSTGEQKLVVDTYLSRGKPEEKRSANYYTGYLAGARLNAQGQVYFSQFPQQRIDVDPMSEAGYQFRSFNPSKGKVLYLGPVGKRPASWKSDFEAIQEQAEGMGRNASVDLSAPEDAGTKKGADKWAVVLRGAILAAEIGPARDKIIAEAVKQLKYAAYLFSGRKALASHYDKIAKDLKDLKDTVSD